MISKTPFFEKHFALNATMTDFHGWQLPLYYSTPVAEHNAVRQQAGLFDTSHMGEILVEGKQAEELLQKVLVRDISAMNAGRMRLAAMCNENGGILDDLTVYKFSGKKFWLVVNAAPYESDLNWVLEKANGMDVKVSGLRAEMAKLDLQGPKAEQILQKLVECNLSKIEYYDFIEAKVAGIDCVVSRSGYAGEDGFEIYFSAGKAIALWNALTEAGTGLNLQPCGLVARDMLRLEAGMLLYGQDIDAEHSILQCPYEKIICWEKEFIGKRALLKQKGHGMQEKLVGFGLIERGIARQGHVIFVDGKKAGVVTSGNFSPTLKKSIGLGYISAEFSSIGVNFDVDVRGKPLKGKVVKTPFYKRGHEL